MTLLAPLPSGAAQASVPSGAAQASAKKDFVRYADNSCVGKNGKVRRCAPWRLRLRSGRVVRLPDARVFTGEGILAKTPFALSPHGSQAAYFRLSDNALVIREVTTGNVRVVPGLRYPVTGPPPLLALSPAGRYVILKREALMPAPPSEPLNLQVPRKVVDTVTGQTRTLPPGELPLSFSPDNAHLLTFRQDGDYNVVYSTRTWTEVRRGPRLSGRFGSLAMDGTTIAHLRDENLPDHIVFTDVTTGRRTARAPISLPPGELGHWLLFDRANNLDVRTSTTPKGRVTRTYRLRRVNEGMRVLDTFKHHPRDTLDVVAGGSLL
ncbi:hypothetical protein GCM10009733_014330 [Nonomuraea maheshkhaliensis]|uniref:WD40 repeat domain-containing protein n=1 Tax=Nonomuraea maheshkhaliensis TaxID=419590 RepID=A0ABP4QR75_9ACTN